MHAKSLSMTADAFFPENRRLQQKITRRLSLFQDVFWQCSMCPRNSIFNSILFLEIDFIHLKQICNTEEI